MLQRSLYLVVIAIVLMSATCKKFECAKSMVEQCSFQMKDIISSPDGTYMAVSGKRVCEGKAVLQEVMIYHKGESLNNKCGNVYITTDTLTTLHIHWKDNMLQVINHGFRSSNTVLREMKIYNKVKVQYGDEVNP